MKVLESSLRKSRVVVFGVVLVYVFCSVAFGQPWSGSGTAEDPYQIWTAVEMQVIGGSGYMNAHFKLMADIDLSAYTGTSFNIIGNSTTKFTGRFDGNGHTISNFTYTSTGTNEIGLFGYLEYRGVKIKDLGLINPNVDAGTGFWVGGLVGRMRKTASISNCYVEGGSVSGNSRVGGLVGEITGSPGPGAITNCYSTASVSGTTNVGGLVGHNRAPEQTVRNCYSEGSVSGDANVGGLVGWNEGVVIKCYSTGSVTGSSNVGGLVGDGPPVCASFWDAQTSGQPTDGGGTPKTTAEMQTASTFIGWGGCGNEGVWVLDEGNDYPRLWWENSPGQPLPTENLSDFVAGTGTEQDPYLIETGEQMNMVGVFWCEWGKHFKLTADIDLSAYTGTSFNIIGIGHYEYTFRGTFDGNGHTISNFSYDSNNTDVIGLFGRGGGIKDLGLINPIVDAGTGNAVGSLVGAGGATGCYVEGGSVSGNEYVGGLFGGGSPSNCTSSASVSGIEYVGGLSGTGSPSNCYSTGSVTGVSSVGGLVGRGGASNSYSRGSVSGYWYVGGLVGSLSGGAEISKCYSAGNVSGISDVGGLVGYKEAGVITDSFWDTETSGQEDSAGGIGLTTELMQSALVFTAAGWDFTTPVWWIDEGVDYPRLAWEAVLSAGIDMDEFWMYQSLPGQSNSDLTAGVSVTDDPMGNTTYSYAWEIVLPGDVTLAPGTVDGGGAGDAYWTLAARGCDEPGGLSDSGQTFMVRVIITGDDYGNTGQAEAEFGIALLGDTNNDGVVNVADRSITNAFWRTGSAGAYTLRDCDVNCDGVVNVADRSIANAIWRGILGQNSVSSPCPLR
jgi:hypothetical protein